MRLGRKYTETGYESQAIDSVTESSYRSPMKADSGTTVEILVICALLAAGCGPGSSRSSIDDETLATVYAELAVTAEGDSVKARRVLDSLGLSREQFVMAVSEKADDLKKWQAVHEAAMRKMDVVALRLDRRSGGDRRREVSTSPLQ
jgi:hypothetical protein